MQGLSSREELKGELTLMISGFGEQLQHYNELMKVVTHTLKS